MKFYEDSINSENFVFIPSLKIIIKFIIIKFNLRNKDEENLRFDSFGSVLNGPMIKSDQIFSIWIAFAIP